MSEERYRRHSVPVRPPAVSILITEHCNRSSSPSENGRRVSFVTSDTSPANLQLPSDEVKTRRHSSTTGPPSIGGSSSRTTLSTLTESGRSENRRPSRTTTLLIEACIKEAENFRKPSPIPAGSSDMAAILRDMRNDGDTVKCNGGNFLSPHYNDDAHNYHSDNEMERSDQAKTKTVRVRKTSAYSMSTRK